MEHSKVTMISYVAMILTSLILLCAFVFPFEYANKFLIPVLALFVISNIFYVWIIRKDPGTVKKSSEVSFVKLNKFFEPSFICPTCEILKPKEARHCYICNKCIDRFDHHCQWVDTCIGHDNHSIFYVYLVTIWSYLALIDFVAITSLNFSL
jgi:palmitoyltransferase ZDHHC13/17